MKKWLYLISPGAMLGVFLFFYFTHIKEAEEHDRQVAIQTAEKKKIDDARKAEIEEKARKDAEVRAAERAAKEAKADAEKLAKQAAEDKKVKDATDDYNAKADVLSKKAAELEITLNTLHSAKDKANRELLDYAKLVERAKVDKRSAELEIQRTTDMVAKRASDSSLARPPVVPTPPAS